MPKTIMNDTKTKMSSAIQAFSRDLASFAQGAQRHPYSIKSPLSITERQRRLTK